MEKIIDKTKKEIRNFLLFDIDYITVDDKPVIRLYGKDNEKTIIAIDESFEPYIYVLSHNIEEAKKEILEISNKTNSNIDTNSNNNSNINNSDNNSDNNDHENINNIDDNSNNKENNNNNNNNKIKKIETITKKIFQVETEIIKITLNHPRDVPKLREEIRKAKKMGNSAIEDIREHDIPFYRRYLINNDIFPMSLLEIKGEKLAEYKYLKKIKKDSEIIRLTEAPKTIEKNISDFNILCFDLEVRNPIGMPDPNTDEIIMIGIATNTGIKKVISTKGEEFENEKDKNYIETVETETKMIERFVDIVKNNNIDIIVGYNSDNFDFPYLKDRSKILDIELDLGWDGSSLNFIKRGYGSAATFKGLIHADLYLIMRRYISLDRYTLERVYLELFGEEKIDVPGDKIWQYWDAGGEKLRKLFDYSLDDVVSTLKIAEMTLPLSLELTRIVGQPFFDIARMATGQQAEWYIVRKAYENNEVVPNKPTTNQANKAEREQNTGGYVKEPEKGLHENLVQFDFRSLYPSLIISKNISPDVLLIKNPFTGEYRKNIAAINLKNLKTDLKENQTRENLINSNNFNISPEKGHKFAKKPIGFIPSVIGNVLNERFKLKRKMKESEDEQEKKSYEVQQKALKRLANTMYGIYGFKRFRWFSNECAESITAWGREYIQDTMKKAEKYGFKAIYADTDGFYAKYDPHLLETNEKNEENIKKD
ncbi:MAG: DNA-directed DNA polymerase [Methanobrevibacter sp.]|jgi:DNA polymerase I|nr:DNA-directed DNA polymerase [Candidatus Methanoflexus mossambicus]